MNPNPFIRNFDNQPDPDETRSEYQRYARKVRHFLWWAAGRSPELMQNCGPVTKMKATATGVFMTVVIFPLSLVAMANLLSMGQLWAPFCFIGGLFWAVAVFSVDRTILVFHRNTPDVHANNQDGQTTNNWKTWGKIATRFGLAIIVSLVITEALIVTFLRGEINTNLDTKAEIAIADAEAKANSSIGDRKATLITENAGLKKHLENLQSRRNELETEMLCEADGTCGTGLRNEGPDYRRKQTAYQRAAEEYATSRGEIDGKIATNNEQLAKLEDIVQNAKKAREESEKQASGFLARHEALFSVIWKSYSALLLYLLMALGLALLEMTPLLQKALSNDDEYDRLIRLEEGEAALNEEMQRGTCNILKAIWKRVAEFIDTGKPKMRDEERGLVRIVHQALVWTLRQRLLGENPDDSMIVINIYVIGHPGVDASIELPKSTAETITLTDLDDEVVKIGKKLDEDGRSQFVWAQNSNGGEVFVTAPLLKQLNADNCVQLLYGKSDSWH